MALVLLSGPIAVGKTTLADFLIREFGFHRVRSSDYLKSLAAARGIRESRDVLQELGDELDYSTDYVCDTPARELRIALHLRN